MIVYNFGGEYAALIIIVAILTSFSRDYDLETVEFRFIKSMYIVTLISVVVTIAALVSGEPGTGTLHTSVAWVCNVLYFVVVPLISLCFLIYVNLVVVLRFDRTHYVKKLLPCVVPYGVYLLVFAALLYSGQVFHISEAQGYVRGDWFQISYVIVVVNLIATAVTVLKNLKNMHSDIKKTMLLITLMAAVFLYIQFRAGTTIMTGIIHTSCILAIHLYALNVKKFTDQLTGVYNRISLIQTMSKRTKKQEHFTLYVFSLCGMKTINERHGIEFGDKVLMRTAQIFFTHTMEKSVFRYAGDEFGLLLDANQPDHDALVQDIIADLDVPQVIDGMEVSIEFLYTRVDYGIFGDNVRELISAVDYSLRNLKEQNGAQRYLYDTSVVQELIKRTNMVRQIKEALDGNMFEMHYQPIYCHQTKTFTQAEALVRMRNGEGYLVYPGDFIDLAVKTGLIVQMTYLILDRVCCDLRHLLDTCGTQISLRAMSVNFPYLQFTDEGMQDKVMAILNKYNITPDMIKIEITEREMIADSITTKAIMKQMEELGFRFELDDFGMDYSNMSVALELPLESIKLDRSFLLAALENQGKQQFFRHLVAGFSGLGAATICEGVEEQSQLDFVVSCGCEYVQGYYFSKPLAPEALGTFLLKNR